MARPAPRRATADSTAKIHEIFARTEQLNKVSELEYAKFFEELRANFLVFPNRRVGASNPYQLNQILRILDSTFQRVERGLTFSGDIQDGSNDPYAARRGEFVLCDASAASFGVVLPDPSLEINEQAKVNVKLVAQTGAFEVTVSVDGGGTIDGNPTVVLNIPDISFTFYVADGEYKIV